MDLLSIIRNTPWWVYCLLAFLLFIGFQATKKGTISLYQMLFALAALSYLTFVTLAPLSLTLGDYLIFASVMLISAIAGWIHASKRIVTVDHEKKHIVVRGTYATLFIILAIFSSKYYTGYKNALDAAYMTTPEYKLIALITCSFGLGFVGGLSLRFLCSLFKKKNGAA